MQKRRINLLVLIGTFTGFTIWGGSGAQSQGVHSEVRVYRVKVEDRESGTYQQQITSYGEGTVDVAVTSQVKVKVLGVTAHQFAYRGNERWKDGRLIYLASASNDNGTPHTLMVTAEANGLKIKENGKERMGSLDAWSTSYWNLPSADQRQRPLVYLDADSGAEYRENWRLVGKETLNVGQQKVKVSHFKVTGDAELELWFDDKERLVRREMMRKGRKTVMELASVTGK